MKSGVIDAVVAHARAAQPEECCGVLLGRADLVEEARPARNVAERPTARFVIDPKDHFDAIREARRRGLEVVGVYHSHPRSPAQPSDTDRAEARDPALYLIVGLGAEPPDVRLFRLAGGNFLALRFVTVG